MQVLKALGVPDADLPVWRDSVQQLRRLPSRGGWLSPYRGLESYRVEDADWFVGRDAELGALLDEIEAVRAGVRPRMVALVGASGSGKSSLLHAGLVARCLAEGWTACSAQPSDHPVEALPTVLTNSDVTRATEVPTRRLLVVDQFEELFESRVGADERNVYLGILESLATGTDGWVVVLGLRADRYDEALGADALVPALSAHQVLLRPPTQSTLRDIITQPALRAGRPVADELVELLLVDLRRGEHDGEVGSLPLLSHVLWETWEHCREQQLTVADYFAAGGLSSAVQKTAEHVYRDLLSDDQKGRARDLFLRLVNIGEDGRIVRRKLSSADLSIEGSFDPVAGAFLESRILTATEDAVQISHDALLRAWPRLLEWLEEDQDALRVRRRIARAASTWVDSGRDPHSLLGGTMLEQATSLDPSAETLLSGLERDFVRQSAATAEQRRAADRRRRRVMRVLFAGTAVLAVVAMVLSVYLVEEVDRVRTQKVAAQVAQRQALSRQVAVQAGDLRSKSPSLAAQLALAAYELSPTVAARSALLTTTALPATSRMTTPPGSTFTVVTPDGHTIAVAGGDGNVRIYDLSDAGHAPTLSGTVRAYGGGPLFALAVSANGRFLAAAGASGKITVIDLSVPAAPTRWDAPLVGPSSGVFGLAFAPDSAELWSTGGTKLLRWRLEAGHATPRGDVDGLNDPFQSIAVSARGVIAAGTTNGQVALWRPSRSERAAPHRFATLDQGATNTVWSLAFSPDGRLLASGARDERVRVWRIGRATRLVTDKLSGFTSWVNSVAFSPNGRLLAAGASGSLTRMWTTNGWSLVDSVPQTSNVTSVNLLTDGALVTAGIDGVVRLRSAATPTLGGFGDAVSGMDITADGRRLYVGPRSTVPDIVPVDASRPGTLRRTGVDLTAPRRAGSPDQVLAVSPDGSTLVVGTREGRLIVWRLRDGVPGPPTVLRASKMLIEEDAFSPDGRYFAAVSDDGTVSVFTAPRGDDKPRLVRRLNAGGPGLNIRFSPDSKMLAVAGVDQKVHWWRLGANSTATALPPLDGFDNYVVGLAFSPDSQLLAAGSADHTVRLWDVHDPGHARLVSRLTGPTNSVLSLAFRRDGQLLAGADLDGTVWLWSLHPSDDDRHVRPTLHAKLLMPDLDARSLLFNPVNDEVVAGSGTGFLREWDTDAKQARDQVCATAGSPVSRQEWRQYFGGAAAYSPPCQ
jgi:WD40 repeat protein